MNSKTIKHCANCKHQKKGMCNRGISCSCVYERFSSLTWSCGPEGKFYEERENIFTKIKKCVGGK